LLLLALATYCVSVSTNVGIVQLLPVTTISRYPSSHDDKQQCSETAHENVSDICSKTVFQID
jgi:hypothetical protein